MSLKKFLTSRIFLINLVGAVVLIVLLIVGTFKWMKSYTHYGESYSVPAMIGLNIKEAAELAAQNQLRVEVIDSVYDKKFAPGVVVDQLPLAKQQVKQNRVVRLTINSMSPEKIKLPRLTDISMRQAQVLVEKYGLFVQNVIYKPSEYEGLVLKVMQGDKELFQGDMVEKGVGVDLFVGHRHAGVRSFVPNLVGFTLDEAQAVLGDSKLNEGVVIYELDVKTPEDSIAAKIWKQFPLSNNDEVDMGTSVDLWLTTDSMKVNCAYGEVNE